MLRTCTGGDEPAVRTFRSGTLSAEIHIRWRPPKIGYIADIAADWDRSEWKNGPRSSLPLAEAASAGTAKRRVLLRTGQPESMLDTPLHVRACPHTHGATRSVCLITYRMARTGRPYTSLLIRTARPSREGETGG